MNSQPIIVPSPRPENEDDYQVDGVQIHWPTYHVLLNHLCRELGVPGAQSFWGAVAWIKEHKIAPAQEPR